MLDRATAAVQVYFEVNLTRGISWRQPCNTVQSAHPKGTHLALAHTGTRLQHVDQAHVADIKASRTCCIDLAGPRRLDSITRAVRCDSYSSTSSSSTSPTKKLSISRDERTIPNHSKCASSHFDLPNPKMATLQTQRPQRTMRAEASSIGLSPAMAFFMGSESHALEVTKHGPRVPPR